MEKEKLKGTEVKVKKRRERSKRVKYEVEEGIFESVMEECAKEIERNVKKLRAKMTERIKNEDRIERIMYKIEYISKRYGENEGRKEIKSIMEENVKMYNRMREIIERKKIKKEKLAEYDLYGEIKEYEKIIKEESEDIIRDYDDIKEEIKIEIKMKREEGVILKIMVDLMENKKKYEENRVILESLREEYMFGKWIIDMVMIKRIKMFINAERIIKGL